MNVDKLMTVEEFLMRLSNFRRATKEMTGEDTILKVTVSPRLYDELLRYRYLSTANACELPFRRSVRTRAAQIKLPARDLEHSEVLTFEGVDILK